MAVYDSLAIKASGMTNSEKVLLLQSARKLSGPQPLSSSPIAAAVMRLTAPSEGSTPSVSIALLNADAAAKAATSATICKGQLDLM